jgi:GntR family transcriptional repressor for pyruvate dehydrogenase complex
MKQPDDNRIRHRKLNELVAAGIKEYILRHSLSEGDRLPTEQQMAEMFGVSRASVREATKALSFLGILRSAPRRGLTVGRVDMHRVTEYLGFHFALNNYPRQQLLKTRIVPETGALSEAMGRIADDPTVYQKLSALNDKLKGVADADEFIVGDLSFHRALMESSGIEPLVAFNGLLEVFFMRFRDQVIAVREHWAKGIEGHGQILLALRNRDLQGAQDLLRKHLAHYQGHL